MSNSLAREVSAAVLIALIALPFGLSIGDIYIDPSDPGFTSQDFPKLATYGIFCLCALILARAAWKRLSGVATVEMEWPAVLAQTRMVGVLVLAALAYIWAIRLFQYALPTFVILAGLLYFFGGRGWVQLLLTPVVMVTLYYLVFFVIFGLYEDPGILLSYDSYGLARTLRHIIGL